MKKVMLAANVLPKEEDLTFPLLVSGKIDGVRACVQDGQCVAGRSLKASLNTWAMEMLSRPGLEGLDGELTVQGERWNDYNWNQSIVMTKSGQPKLTFHVFDLIGPGSAINRKDEARAKAVFFAMFFEDFPIEINFCEQFLVHSYADLMAKYEHFRNLGYEGLIMMDPEGHYKHGRSTLKQGLMLKLKPSDDDEATILDVEPVYHNMDAGNSNKKENMVEGDRAGKIIALWKGRKINVGPGKLTHDQARDLLANKEGYKGKQFTFTYMELHESGEPRSARFKGWRPYGS